MMRAATAISFVVVAACSFEAGTLAVRDGAPGSDDVLLIDAPPDGPPDATQDARACPQPPDNCTALTCAGSTSCYYVCGNTTTSKQNYAGAKSSCASNEIGCIVTINSIEENECIRAATNPLFPSAMVWIGWEQASNGQEPAGGWGWACGTSTFVAGNWGDPLGDPNNTNNNEDCATMIQGGAWIDADCGGTSRFVCELP